MNKYRNKQTKNLLEIQTLDLHPVFTESESAF